MNPCSPLRSCSVTSCSVWPKTWPGPRKRVRVGLKSVPAGASHMSLMKQPKTRTGPKVSVYLQPFLLMRRKATEFSEITRLLALLRRSRSSRVTEFGTNRKLICDFLFVIKTNSASVFNRFRYIAFDRSKITIFGYLIVFNSLDGGVPSSLGRSP